MNLITLIFISNCLNQTIMFFLDSCFSMVKPEMLQSNHRSSFQDYPWIYEEPAPIPCGVQYGRVLGDDCIQVITDNSRMCNCNGGGYEYPGCCCGKLPLVYPDITCPCCKLLCNCLKYVHNQQSV